MKKLFIISVILLVIVLFFLGVYNFAFKKEVPVVALPVKPATVVKNPIVEKKSEKIVALTDKKVMGAVFEKKSQVVTFYDAQDGTTWSVSPLTKEKSQLSMTKIAGLKNVLWSPDHSKVLTTTEKDGQSSFYEYDYAAKKGVQLKDGLDTAVWDNTGAKIYYKYFEKTSGKRSLNIANPDGSGWQKVADIDWRNLAVAPVPLSSVVSFWNFPNAKEESKLQIVGATGGEVKTILAGRFGADYLWSSDGSQALVSSLKNQTSNAVTLGKVTTDGQYQDLNIPTLVSKCAWSSDGKTLYYALPGDIPEGAVMPDDYQNNKFATQDTFWKMNMETGEKERLVEVADMSGKYDSTNMFLSSEEDFLFFINKIDEKLYEIEL